MGRRRSMSMVMVVGLVLGLLTVPATAVDGPLARVYVASGRNFPDALSGGVLAALSGAPILLVEQDGLPDETRDELERLQPKEIVVFGGPVAVSDGVLAALDQLDTGGGVRRIAGDTRFETATAIAREVEVALPYARANQSCPSGQVITAIKKDGTLTCKADAAGLQRADGVIVVAKDGTGDFDDPRDAVAFIDAQPGFQRWLIDVAPGEYDLGSEGVSIASHHLRGAGAGLTVLTSTRTAPTLANFGGTVTVSGDGLVSDMTVTNTATGAARAVAIGMFNSGRLRNVRASSSGANAENVAVHLSTVGGEIHDSEFVAQNATDRNIAMASVGTQSSFDMDVYNSLLHGGAPSAFEGCSANDPTGYGYLGRNNSQTMRFHESRICGSRGGIHIQLPPSGVAGTVYVSGGYVRSSGATAGSSTLMTGASGLIRAANVLIGGATPDGGGSVTCRDTYSPTLADVTC